MQCENAPSDVQLELIDLPYDTLPAEYFSADAVDSFYLGTSREAADVCFLLSPSLQLKRETTSLSFAEEQDKTA
ncbi:hypothetical protein chiPu_0006296 [Chiloscyllium punctatum]|uniref:Uncharacterized protein n=1 Tax=Chiloscyllium punctatum TaxID=137246 RepID=A0A401SBY4_CHIPU|nr:hypothetical protein [Chiloscyllium punctatum]